MMYHVSCIISIYQIDWTLKRPHPNSIQLPTKMWSWKTFFYCCAWRNTKTKFISQLLLSYLSINFQSQLLLIENRESLIIDKAPTFFIRMKPSFLEKHLDLALIILSMMGGKFIKFSFLPTMLKNVVSQGPVSALTGIQFGDNGGQNFVTEKNGVARATTEVLKNLCRIIWRIKSIRFLIN